MGIMGQGEEREEGKQIKYFKTPSSYPGPWYFDQNKEGDRRTSK